MARLQDIVRYCNQFLDIDSFDDYCPNGLQVEGSAEVRNIVSGVTASQALIDAAVDTAADMLLVHHGYFWRGEPAALVGMKGRRVRSLMGAEISLLAYHLPLDAHPELGNNRQLGLRLGFDAGSAVEGLLWGADLIEPLVAGELARRVESGLGRAPLMIGSPDTKLHRVAWCTGGAQGMIAQAAAVGFDAFISGEISEQTVHEARELGLVYLSAGHHATERYGVQSLGDRLARQFDVQHRFIDIDNPA
jgi:dinuclear metal center YbgI/SA1388 family protein